MIKTTLFLALLLAVGLAVAGCTEGDDATQTEAEVREEYDDWVEEDGTSDAARSRGVADEGDGDEEGAGPTIVLNDLSYEWRLVPKRGLHVRLVFENPESGYERARGRVFLIASRTLATGDVRGGYPWNAEFDESGPTDHRDGTHLLFRKDQEVRAFIPYAEGEGHYDSLRILVYDDEGNMLIDRVYELDITGDPTGVRRPKPDLVL